MPCESIEQQTSRHVVIVGGGFAGRSVMPRAFTRINRSWLLHQHHVKSKTPYLTDFLRACNPP